MSRRVIPAGDSLIDSILAGGEADRIGAAYSSDPITRWQTHDILLCEGESLTRASLFSMRNLPTTMGHSTGLIREQCPVW